MILSDILPTLSSKLARCAPNIEPNIVLMISALGVYIVNAEKLRCRRRSTINEPDLWFRQLKNRISYKNLRSSNYSLLKIEP